MRGMRTAVEGLRGVLTAMRKSSGDSKELQAKIKSLTRQLQESEANNPVKQEDKPPTPILDLQHEVCRLRTQFFEALDAWKSDARSLRECLAEEISRNEQMRKPGHREGQGVGCFEEGVGESDRRGVAALENVTAVDGRTTSVLTGSSTRSHRRCDSSEYVFVHRYESDLLLSQ